MSFPRKQTLTAASLAARRRNALLTSGPRTARGKQRAAMNALKNGLWSESFRRILVKAGDPLWKFEGVSACLALVLKPCNRPERARLERYARMLWSINRRTRRFRSPLVAHKPRLQLTRAERAHQKRIMKDLQAAGGRARYADRRKAEPFMRVIRYTDWMAKSGEMKTQNEERSWNVF